MSRGHLDGRNRSVSQENLKNRCQTELSSSDPQPERFAVSSLEFETAVGWFLPDSVSGPSFYNSDRTFLVSPF